MKEYDLEITSDIIKESIEKDILGRNHKLNKLMEMLNAIKNNKIISIDGKWGCGKSVFLKQLEYINKNEIQLNDKFNNLENFKEKYVVLYYNAWENDFHNSPLLSLIYNLINDFPKEKSQTASGKIELPFDLTECLKTISHDFINLDKVKNYEDLTKEIHTSEEKKQALNNIIDNILPKGKRLIFIIDELDRCKPDYAVDMIETIKHFYTNDKVIFLLGTNNLQLSYTISNYYGNGFDGYGYLNKIYNLVIELGDISTKKYIESITARRETSDWCDADLYGVCSYFNMSMREINRLLNDFDLLDEYMHTSYGGSLSEDTTIKYLFLPYCLGLKIVNRNELNKFFNGQGYEKLKDFIFLNEGLIEILKRCYETKKPDIGQISDEEKKKILEIFLKQKYNDYFVERNQTWQINEIKTKFLDTFSLLSGYSKLTLEE